MINNLADTREVAAAGTQKISWKAAKRSVPLLGGTERYEVNLLKMLV
jgi:hypothetical protein